MRSNEPYSQADLARRLGVSRARVTQLFRLLDLNPQVLNAIIDLGDPLPKPIVTERKLRSLVTLPESEQLRSVKALLHR